MMNSETPTVSPSIDIRVVKPTDYTLLANSDPEVPFGSVVSL